MGKKNRRVFVKCFDCDQHEKNTAVFLFCGKGLGTIMYRV